MGQTQRGNDRPGAQNHGPRLHDRNELDGSGADRNNGKASRQDDHRKGLGVRPMPYFRNVTGLTITITYNRIGEEINKK